VTSLPGTFGRANKEPPRPVTAYFLVAVETVKEKKHRCVEAEARRGPAVCSWA
jgi:hypothetical protein